MAEGNDLMRGGEGSRAGGELEPVGPLDPAVSQAKGSDPRPPDLLPIGKHGKRNPQESPGNGKSDSSVTEAKIKDAHESSKELAEEGRQPTNDWEQN